MSNVSKIEPEIQIIKNGTPIYKMYLIQGIYTTNSSGYVDIDISGLNFSVKPNYGFAQCISHTNYACIYDYDSSTNIKLAIPVRNIANGGAFVPNTTVRLMVLLA